MHVLTVLAHPNPQAYNVAVCDAFTAGLAAAGHSSTVVDLYRDGFDPLLTGADFMAFRAGEAPADIAGYQQQIAAAQALALVCPVWWFSVPAMLKGWIDRVFSMNFAYRFREDGSIEGLLGAYLQKAIVIQTCGGPEAEYEQAGFKAALTKTIDDGILRFSGIPAVEHVLLYNVIATTDAVRKEYLAQVRGIGERF